MIKKEMIALDVDENDKVKVIKHIIKMAFNTGLIGDEELFLKAVLKREADVSTSIGFTVAIPHGKSSTVKEPFISYLRTKKPFIWDKGTKDMDQNIFLIGVPKEGGDKIHLKYLSEISKKLLDENFRKRLFASKTVDSVYELLTTIV